MTNIDLRTEQTVGLVVPHGHDVEAGGGVAQECCLRAGRSPQGSDTYFGEYFLINNWLIV